MRRLFDSGREQSERPDGVERLRSGGKSADIDVGCIGVGVDGAADGSSRFVGANAEELCQKAKD